MKTITQVAKAIQTILGPVSDQMGLETGFNQRQSKVTGSKFMQMLVFGSLENPDLSYSDLVSAAKNVGVVITKQGLEQRFSERSADLARRVLELAVQQVISTEALAVPLLERFSGVYIRDSSVISLPKGLEKIWPGCSTSAGSNAALKLHVRLELCQGQLAGPILAAGREHDSDSPFQSEALPKGAVRIGDLAYFSLNQFAADTQQGIGWVSRFKTGTCIYTPEGEPINLLAWLRQQPASQAERPILLGKTQRLACRLLVEHLPPAAVEQRKRKLREYARKQQTPLTAELLELAQWTLLLTNISVDQLSIPEALVLVRVRWQIELLFKRWKSLFKVDEWRSQDIWRILTELYAKLLGVVVEQWILLTGIGQVAHPSFWKAALVVRQFAPLLALTLPFRSQLEDVLSLISRHFRSHCHLDTRHARPSLYQLLENLFVQS